MVKRLLNLKKKCLKKQRVVLKKKNQIAFGDRTLAYSGAKVPSRFYPGDLVTRTGDREIHLYLGELACMQSLCMAIAQSLSTVI